MLIKEEDISLKAVLGYLGYKGQTLSPTMLETIKEGIRLGVKTAKPRYTGKSFPLIFNNETKEIKLKGGDLALRDSSSWQQLSGATEGVFFAVTLGSEIDNLLKRTQLTNLTLSFILEGVATQMVEVAANMAQNELKAPWIAKGLYTNRRFSPGYGDIPLGLQPSFLQLLATERAIGLTVTPDFIMLPRKSVTAFFGVFPNKPKGEADPPCTLCNLKGCSHRKEVKE